MSSVIFILLLAISPVLAVLDALGAQTFTAPPSCSEVSGPGGDTAVEHAHVQMRGSVLVCARPS
jgi:hypothetical protein